MSTHEKLKADDKFVNEFGFGYNQVTLNIEKKKLQEDPDLVDLVKKYQAKTQAYVAEIQSLKQEQVLQAQMQAMKIGAEQEQQP